MTYNGVIDILGMKIINKESKQKQSWIFQENGSCNQAFLTFGFNNITKIWQTLHPSPCNRFNLICFLIYKGGYHFVTSNGVANDLAIEIIRWINWIVESNSPVVTRVLSRPNIVTPWFDPNAFVSPPKFPKLAFFLTLFLFFFLFIFLFHERHLGTLLRNRFFIALVRNHKW